MKTDGKAKLPEVNKAKQKALKALEQAQAHFNEYKQAMEKTNERQKTFYSKEMPSLLNEFEEHEEARLRFMKLNMRSYAALETEIPVEYQRAAMLISQSATNVDSKKDIELLLDHHGTRNYPQQPFEIERPFLSNITPTFEIFDWSEGAPASRSAPDISSSGASAKSPGEASSSPVSIPHPDAGTSAASSSPPSERSPTEATVDRPAAESATVPATRPSSETSPPALVTSPRGFTKATTPSKRDSTWVRSSRPSVVIGRPDNSISQEDLIALRASVSAESLQLQSTPAKPPKPMMGSASPPSSEAASAPPPAPASVAPAEPAVSVPAGSVPGVAPPASSTASLQVTISYTLTDPRNPMSNTQKTATVGYEPSFTVAQVIELFHQLPDIKSRNFREIILCTDDGTELEDDENLQTCIADQAVLSAIFF
jgi:hypothetical protein